jgi:hypothetical protein
MHLIDQCTNCGGNVRPELGVATATTVQHRECADRFGVGTHGELSPTPSPPSFALTRPVRGRPRASAFTSPVRVLGRSYPARLGRSLPSAHPVPT